jgi:uncharacterized protein (TIGR03905 family)
MKRILILAMVAMFCATVQAQEKTVANQVKQEVVAEDYKIIKDEVVDGIRYVVAVPSAIVCSKQIDIQIQDGIIRSVVYTRGCDGNAKGIGALIKGMSVEEAIRRLEGITCGKRPTSCPDQLAKVLKSLN